MDNVVDVISVPNDDSVRYLVEYEWDSDLEWVVGDGLGFQATSVARNTRRVSTPDAYRKEFERIAEETTGGWDDVAKAFADYLTLNGVPNKVITLQGHTQGEWSEGVAYITPDAMTAKNGYTNDERLESLIKSLRDWWSGDVYRVTKQELVTYYTADGSKTHQQWEDVEDADVLSGFTGEVTLAICQEWIG